MQFSQIKIFLLQQRVCEWLLTIDSQFFSYNMARESYIFMSIYDVCFEIDYHASIKFYVTNSLKQHFEGRQLTTKFVHFFTSQQPVITFMLNFVCFVEKHQILIS